MDELQSSQYLKATYQCSGGLIHLSGWHPNRLGGEGEGEWISPDRVKSIRGRRVPGTKKCRDSDYVRICFFVINERFADVWHLDSNCLVTTQQLPRAKPA